MNSKMILCFQVLKFMRFKKLKWEYDKEKLRDKKIYY